MKQTMQLGGFVSVLMLMLISFLIVFTTITWRSLSYVHQLAHERAVFLQTYCDAHTIGLELIALTKNRFDQIMNRVTKTGTDLVFSLPFNAKKNTPRAVIKKNNPTQLSIEVTIPHEYQRTMKCSCTIIKESHQEVTGLKTTYKVVNFICN